MYDLNVNKQDERLRAENTLVEKGATIPVPEALLYRKSNRY
jgi:hypothetical protein